jgi:hypothetical protein
MRDIVEYKVVSDNQLEKMVSEVNSLISEGWEPLGGLQVVAPGPAPLYSQAMVKVRLTWGGEASEKV